MGVNFTSQADFLSLS